MNHSENIYPAAYAQSEQKPESEVIQTRLNLDLSNIDELAAKWLTDKAYAFAERLVGAIQYLSTIAVGGFVGLSVHYLGGTFGAITTHCGLRSQRLTYYRKAHAECHDDYRLTYHEEHDVNWAFNHLQKSMYRSGIMLGIAGAMLATTFGAKWLKGYIGHCRKTSQENSRLHD